MKCVYCNEDKPVEECFVNDADSSEIICEDCKDDYLDDYWDNSFTQCDESDNK